MRVLAIHDGVGNITSLMAWPADMPEAGVRLEHGEYAHEIEVPGLDDAADHTERSRILDEVVETYRVAVSPDASKAELTRK
jgi:hypothetical protein